MTKNATAHFIAALVRENPQAVWSQAELNTLHTEIENKNSLQIKRITLAKCNLNTLPAEIGNLQQLEKLDVRATKLQALPPEIGQLQKLQSLELSESELTLLPAEIGTHSLQPYQSSLISYQTCGILACKQPNLAYQKI